MTKRCCSLILLCTLALATTIQAAVVFDRGATWRWRTGATEASTPVEAWRTNGFNDAAFTPAPAPFWYGDVLAGGTQIIGMQNVYGCIFLRQTFVVTNLTEVAGLRLGALVDDGFVAWINGSEVKRVNLSDPPGTPVTTATLAINAVEPVPFVIYTLPNPSGYLLAGTNTIAVQVFQTVLNSSDLGFDASLETVLAETNPPAILSVLPAPGTVSNLTQITVTFSEPVAGVDAGDLLLNGLAASLVTPVGAATYTFTFTQPAYGAVALTWNAAHNITDQALPPNLFNATGPGATWSYALEDRTVPVVTLLTPAAGSTVRGLSNLIVVFSESVSGVQASDLLINNSPASGLTVVAANQFVFDFTQPPTGAVQMAWATGHGITDQAAVPNPFAGGSWTYLLDPTAAEAPPYISEFMASNTRTLADENGDFSDWIEIYNPSRLTVNLDGWYLADSPDSGKWWRFPATNLGGGAFLVVFASAKDRRIPGTRLHTHFRLATGDPVNGGEYLALLKPDGSVASEFSPVYPSQVPDVSYGLAQFASGTLFTAGTNGVYFTAPTPGAANLGGVTNPGPVIAHVQHTPNVPLDDQDLLVTARVAPSFFPVANVTMRYRIMFNNEVTTPMFDDGAHGDGAAGDGVFGATVPASLSTNGQMIRYLIAATDANANASRWPLFSSATTSAEYLGTIVNPTHLTSKLPIFHLFISAQNLPGVDTESGGRISLFYDGEFYDNIYMERRGNTSAGQVKKSHRLEFNREHLFRHLPEYPRVRKTSLMAEFLDPAYLRQHLCFWLLEQMGVPSPFFYPVRGQLNGDFYGLVFHNDVIDEEQVARMGYDPAGALYKAAGIVSTSRFSTGVFQKKTEPLTDFSDYMALAGAISEVNTLTDRRTAVFDRLDLPEVINYLAGARWCAENDDVWANMSLYRDTYGDGLWRIVPFDMNASWGQRYGGITPLDAINDNCKSHPLYGGSAIIACDGGNYNRIYDTIITLPETRQMLLRRQRTILDRWVMEPGVAPESRRLETHIRSMTNLIWTEAFLDRAKWGYSTWTASNKPLNTGVDELFNEFINLRRIHFSVTHCLTNTAKPIGVGKTFNAGIPLSQPSDAVIQVVSLDFNPASGNQAQEYLCLTNPHPTALDISGWRLEGAIHFTFKPGTVVPSNQVLYVASDLNAFRARAAGPRGGQGLFVVGPWGGQLSARGETVLVFNDAGALVASNSYVGAPSLAQQFLRISELMFNPPPLAGNANDAQEFEFVELVNTSPTVTLDLRGVRFTNGIEFSFTGGAVTHLGPQQRVVIVKNLAAFAARYGSLPNLAGTYAGALDSGGERLQLLDASNEEILDFSYNNGWYPITDGLGFSLVVVDEFATPDAWNTKANWRPSGVVNGSPGVVDSPPPVIAPVLVNEVLSRTDVPPPTDSIELFNPATNDVNIGGWFLSDDFSTPNKFRLPNNTLIAAGGFQVFTEDDFNPNGQGFALGSDGDEVWLFSADALGNLTGYYHGFQFGAAENGVSFGRYVNSQGAEDFVAQRAPTFGTNNAAPLVGPVVVSEIMYHPPALTSNDPPSAFLELHNLTATNVPLFHAAAPTNTWRLREAADFDFPTNVTLPPDGRVLVVGFDPATNASALAAFRARYGVSTNVPVFGPWRGSLPNDDGVVELRKPDATASANPAYVRVEQVHYYDGPPWPCGTDGTGASLQRQRPGEYSNDPMNWAGAPPTAGQTNALVPPGAPTLTTPPDPRAVVGGSSAGFSVVACGTPVFYQWQFHGTNLPGATNAALTLNHVQPEHAGPYAVVAWNAFGGVTSAPALLTVLSPPAFTLQPQSQIVSRGATACFEVAVAGDAPITLQWQLNGTNLAGATNLTLTLANAQPSQAGAYRARAGNAVSVAYSDAATLIVTYPITITSPPQSQTHWPSSNVVFSVGLTGSQPLTYQWRWNGAHLPAATNATLQLLSVLPANAGAYSVVVTNTVSAATSAPALLTVHTNPLILTQPVGRSAVVGSNAVFSVAAFSSTPVRYQWRFNGANLPGATSAALTLTNVQMNQSGDYAVVATDNYGSITSANATLWVVVSPVITRQPQPSNQVVVVDSLARITVSASGTLPLSYRWRKNGITFTNLTLNDTNCTLDYSSASLTNAGYYEVVVTNLIGAAVSQRAYLAVLEPLTHRTARVGENVTFSPLACTFYPAASGTQQPTLILKYYWWFNHTNLLASAVNETLTLTNLILTLTNVQATHSGIYTVVATNAVGTVLTQSAILTVEEAPLAILSQPRSLVATQSTTVCFSVMATGAPPVTYLWRFNSSDLPWANTATLCLTNVQLAHEGAYEVVVRDASRSTNSAAATLTLDSNGDGIPDAWGVAHGFDPFDPNLTSQDPDGDGLNNGREWTAGTDPANSNSVLRVRITASDSGFALSFDAVSNRIYRLLSADRVPSSVWSNRSVLPSGGTNRPAVLMDTNPVPPRFYRIQVERWP